VLAGEPGNLAEFRRGLPPRIAEPVIGTVAGARHEAADVIVARDAKTGECLVAFGRERIQQARDAGAEEVPALVVPINRGADELERLAAACLVLKGRHDL